LKIGIIIFALAFSFELPAANTNEERQDPRLPIAEDVISAFYTWDSKALAQAIVAGPDRDRMLYYQGWAQAANYAIQTRTPCFTDSTDAVICRVTVTDDFGRILGYIATDTFTFSIIDEAVVALSSEGDDPPIFWDLIAWITETRPEVMDGPCQKYFSGGTTPGACAKAVVESARIFRDLSR
jgi:hypothetical protein